MVRRLAIALTLVLALWAASAQVPLQTCAMSMPAVQKAPCTECCAKMKFCVLPPQNQTPPATATASSQQSIVLVAQPVQSLVAQAWVTSPRLDCSGAEILPNSPSRLAVLCTFLI